MRRLPGAMLSKQSPPKRRLAVARAAPAALPSTASKARARRTSMPHFPPGNQRRTADPCRGPCTLPDTEAEAEPLSNADSESGVAEVEPTAPLTKTSSRRSSKRGAITEAPSEDAENPACGFAGEYLQVELIGRSVPRTLYMSVRPCVICAAGKGSTGEVPRRPLAALDTNADAARYALRNRGEKSLKRIAIENEARAFTCSLAHVLL